MLANEPIISIRPGVGELNARLVRDFLDNERIQLVAKDLDGIHGRVIVVGLISEHPVLPITAQLSTSFLTMFTFEQAAFLCYSCHHEFRR